MTTLVHSARRFRDLADIRHAVRTLQDVVTDLPPAYRGLSDALDLLHRNNLLDPTQDVVDLEHALKSAQTALAAAATKAAEIAAEHQVLLHALARVAGPAATPEPAPHPTA